MMKAKYLFITLTFLLIYSNSFSQSQKIKWTKFEKAILDLKPDSKPMFIDIYTDWCGWCKKMDATTFKDSTVIAAMNAYFTPIKLDGEHKDTIEFKGYKYKYVQNGRRGYNELTAALTNNKLSYPTYVLLNKDFQIIQAIPGYIEAKLMEKVLVYFGSEIYLEKTWEEFETEFEMLKKPPKTEDVASGWALTSEGYIATNYNVVEGAKSINIKGINGDFTKSFEADVKFIDKKNDLAILEIIDSSFKKIKKVPYGLSKDYYNVGSTVYVTGYATGTDEQVIFKTNNGILSSKSGFKKDTSFYQVTALTQATNFGGPVFDEYGNIIGILTSKAIDKENVKFVLKTNSILELAPSLKIQSTDKKGKKPTTLKKVKNFEKFIYLVEVKY